MRDLWGRVLRKGLPRRASERGYPRNETRGGKGAPPTPSPALSPSTTGSPRERNPHTLASGEREDPILRGNSRGLTRARLETPSLRQVSATSGWKIFHADGKIRRVESCYVFTELIFSTRTTLRVLRLAPGGTSPLRCQTQ